MSYRARFKPTGEYYDRRDYRKVSKTGSLFKKLTKRQLTGYLRSSNCKEVHRNMDEWIIESYAPSGAYSFECIAVYGGDHTDWKTIIHDSFSIEVGDRANNGPFELKDGKKYRVTISEIIV